jgi:predicted transcriptional regulator
MTKVTKLSVNLSDDVVAEIRRLAAKRKVTMTEVIRDAIGTEKFIEDEKSRSKFLLEDSNGKLRQVVFR